MSLREAILTADMDAFYPDRASALAAPEPPG
jgi:hypothetical protein